MTKKNIPFNQPEIDERIYPYLKQVIESGKLSGDGPMGKAAEKQIENLFSVRHALLTTSGTHALEIATLLLSLRPGDEVLLPSFTFVSTANAILRGGGTPVFCDINDRTFTIDLGEIERRLTPKTRAIIAVHYAGVSAEMNEIMELAERRNLVVIEDAAQGVNAKYRHQFLGKIGHCGAYSFHDTKNYISGEGGAFLTGDDVIARRAEIIREKGTNRANFLRGEVDKYTWIEPGSSYILSDLLAAVLKYQLDNLEPIQKRRKQIHDAYITRLKDLENRERLRLPIIPSYCESNYHIFYILLPDEAKRNQLMQSAKARGVNTTFHYVPLHSSPFATKVLGTSRLQLPVTDNVSGCLLRLPIYPRLKNEDVDYIVETLHELLA